MCVVKRASQWKSPEEDENSARGDGTSCFPLDMLDSPTELVVSQTAADGLVCGHLWGRTRTTDKTVGCVRAECRVSSLNKRQIV